MSTDRSRFAENHRRAPRAFAEFPRSLDRAALFFDVDGTLLAIRDHPADVVADRGLLRLLERLRAAAGGALALVSGRALGDIDRIFSPLTFAAAALHGAEIRFADGTARAADPRLMDRLRPEVARFVAQAPGLMLEDKGAALAIHFRGRPEMATDVLRFLTKLSFDGRFAVQPGKFVAELKPAEVNKGEAIARLLESSPFAGRRPWFFGDDLTDEAGFAKVNAENGISVRVGEAAVETQARLHVGEVERLRVYLASLVEAA